MTAEEIMLVTRMGERLLGVLIGGMSVYLGFRLFLALPEQTDSEGKIILPGGIDILFSRIGPGVFFALFGAALVITAFRQPVTLGTNIVVDEKQANGASSYRHETRNLQGMGSLATSSPSEETLLSEARKQIFVLNHQLAASLKPDLHSSDRNELDVAVDYAKRQILLGVWQPNWPPYSEFELWINQGEPKPAPEKLKDVANIFTLGREDKP